MQLACSADVEGKKKSLPLKGEADRLSYQVRWRGQVTVGKISLGETGANSRPQEKLAARRAD